MHAMLFLAIDCNEEEHMSVYSLGALRVIDLTKPLDPKTETNDVISILQHRGPIRTTTPSWI